MKFPTVHLLVATGAAGLTLRVSPSHAAPVFTDSLPAHSSIVDEGPHDILWLADESAEPHGLRGAVNRVPGVALLSRKQSLAAAGRTLGWSFVPESATTAADALALGDEPYSWLLKGGGHRNVSVPHRLPAAAALDGALAKGVLQRRVDPPMLGPDGRGFDLGVYVVVVRRPGAHLTYRIYDEDVLLRFCRDPYVSPSDVAAGSEKPEASWLVDDTYTALWDIPALSATPTGRAALRAIVNGAARGGGPELTSDAATWTQLEHAVAQTLSAVPSAPADALTRFELLRYDFVLDHTARPFLIEVNSNPNLVPYHGSTEHADLVRRVLQFVWETVETPKAGRAVKVRPPSDLTHTVC